MLATVDDGPQFLGAVMSSESQVAGRLGALNNDQSATLGDASFPAGEFIELIQRGMVRPAFPWDRPHLLLVNGDWWPGQVMEIKDDRIRFNPSFGKSHDLIIPVSAVAYAWLMSPRPNDIPDPSKPNLVISKRSTDSVWLTNNDELRGTILSLDRTALGIETNGQSHNISTERVRAMAFNSELAQSPKQKDPIAQFLLSSGARVSLSGPTLQDGRIVGRSLAGVEIRLILSEIVRIEFRSNRVMYLDGLKPIRYEHTPYLNTRWPLGINRSTFENRPMRLGQHVFDRGLGIHSQSKLTFVIPAGASRFEAWAGLDADGGRLGDVSVSVSVDDRVVFGPAKFIGTTPLNRIVVKLPDAAKELTLTVDFSGNGDVQDHFDFADARFILGQSASKVER